VAHPASGAISVAAISAADIATSPGTIPSM
jgi:hypothetical protein